VRAVPYASKEKPDVAQPERAEIRHTYRRWESEWLAGC
jgi:hypothetical protein